MCLFQLLANKTNNAGQYTNNNDAKNQMGEIVFDNWHVAK
jgi:hypothetical protein